mmetsp:Transcript_60381/g.191799  ORF Transcript_60381/g.191799 Transcript_60381/m.191799 type:complete len:280 (-) Transcript_60381:24-863(-)
MLKRAFWTHPRTLAWMRQVAHQVMSHSLRAAALCASVCGRSRNRSANSLYAPPSRRFFTSASVRFLVTLAPNFPTPLTTAAMPFIPSPLGVPGSALLGRRTLVPSPLGESTLMIRRRLMPRSGSSMLPMDDLRLVGDRPTGETSGDVSGEPYAYCSSTRFTNACTFAKSRIPARRWRSGTNSPWPPSCMEKCPTSSSSLSSPPIASRNMLPSCIFFWASRPFPVSGLASSLSASFPTSSTDFILPSPDMSLLPRHNWCANPLPRRMRPLAPILGRQSMP